MKPILNNNTETPYQPIKDRSKKVMTISVFAFFIGFALIIVLYPYILINFFTLSKIFIGFTVAGFIIPLKLYQKWFQFIKYEMILFNILGSGPLLTGLFLTFNLLFTNNAQTINYEIIGCKINGNSVDLELRSEIQHINPKITNINDVDIEAFSKAKTIDITIADGIFGLKVIKGRTFKP